MSWWLFVPTLVPVIILSVWPLLQGLYMGFTSDELGAAGRSFVGLANFQQMLGDTQFWSSFRIGGVLSLIHI